MKAEEIKKLVRRVQRHEDREAADILIRHFYREIYAFVYRQTGNEELAMDLTQEVFISVLLSIPGYDPNKGGFRTWLYRIASNKVVDFFRSAYHRQMKLGVDVDTFEETAAALSLPVSTVKTKYYSALRMLRGKVQS